MRTSRTTRRAGTAAAMTLACGLALLTACAKKPPTVDSATAIPPPGQATLYHGGDILTMEGDSPQYAEAVVVKNGSIVFVGKEADALQAAGKGAHEVDLAGRTMMPGFIDPHNHPVQASSMLMPKFVTPFDWKFPWGDAPAVRGADAFMAKVKSNEAALTDPKEPLVIWGYLKPYHGPLTRSMLDEVSRTRPIIVWSYSAHEMYFNSAALDTYGLTAKQAEGNKQINYVDGTYIEAAMIEVAVPKIKHVLMDPVKLDTGMNRLGQLIHAGGVTTTGDMGTGSSADLAADLAMIRNTLDNEASPFRVRLVPDVKTLAVLHPKEDELVALVKDLPRQNSTRLLFGNQVKLYADGAFFAEAMQLEPPGYKDGHHGEWMAPPEVTGKNMAVWWKQGYDIHVHVNGSKAVSLVLDQVEKLSAANPSKGQRIIIEHFGVSTREQAERMATLGVIVSANPYYLYSMSDFYADGNLGKERASEIVRLGSLLKNKVRFALHTDFTMAPLEPLLLAWIAVNRVTANGTEMAPQEKVPVYTALQGITSNAAYVLRLEDQTGSIRVGKKADFVILAENPMKIDPMKIKDIKVLGTVFEGKSYPLN